MHYEEEGEQLKDKSACSGVRADLKMCLLQSDCCKRVNHILIRILNNFNNPII